MQLNFRHQPIFPTEGKLSKCDEKFIHKKMKCIYCKALLTLGPTGGASRNLLCINCGARYNDMGPFGIELINGQIYKTR